MMLTHEQWTVLEALVNRIIPADEFPCGWDAGVGDYLTVQFQGDLRGCLDAYGAGLDALEREAQADTQQRFVEMPPVAQDALLARIEASDVNASWPVNPSRFLSLVAGHAMEGFYADPGNGGNRDGVSWRMIGFEVRG